MYQDKNLQSAFDESFSALVAQGGDLGAYAGDYEPADHLSVFLPTASQGASVAVSGGVSHGSVGSDREPLANRGATFPDELGRGDEIDVSVEDLRQSSSARWRLKKTVVKILRQHGQREDGRSFSVCGCGYAGKYKDADGDLKTIPSVKIVRKDAGSKPFVSGSLRCESPWLCPTCAPGRAVKRQEKLREVIEHCDAMGGTSAFVTLTLSHKLGQALSSLKAILSTASRKARSGRRWGQIQAVADVLGVIQCVEVLHSSVTGWHYHAHLLAPCLGKPEAVKEAMEAFVSAYMDEVVKLGGKAEVQGQDIQIIDPDDRSVDQVAFYASKGSAAWEIAGGLKEARGRASRNPWDLAQLANAGDEGAKALFVEYAENIVGTRSGVVSASIAKKLMIEPSQEDDDKQTIVEDDGEDDDINVELESQKWHKLLSYGVAWKVIESAEHATSNIVVEGVIANLFDEIEVKERASAARSVEEQREWNKWRVDAEQLAKRIVDYAVSGYSWEKSYSLAIDEQRTQMGFYGRNEMVLPDKNLVGRHISRIRSERW